MAFHEKFWLTWLILWVIIVFVGSTTTDYERINKPLRYLVIFWMAIPIVAGLVYIWIH